MNKVHHHIIIALLLSFTQLSSVSLAGDDAIEGIIERQTLRIGISDYQPPYVMTNKKGDLIGFDIDLAIAIASAMNVKPEFVQMPFPKLLPNLSTDKVDMVLSGLNINIERANDFLFVGPYMMSGKSILTNSHALVNHAEPESLNSSELKVSALKDSTSAIFVKSMMQNVELTEVENYEQAINLVREDKVDLMVADMAICILATMKFPSEQLLTLSSPLSIEPVGIAISADHLGLYNLTQNYYTSYQELGLIDKLRKKWFQNDDWIEQLPKKDIQL